MRVLGVDFGGARIGIAVGEMEHGVTTARPALVAAGSLAGDAESIASRAKDEDADAVIVGVPVNPADTRMERICRQLAARLREHGLAVHEIDEAFTSAEADAKLLGAGLKASKRKRLHDGEAARLIIERFFNETR